MKTRKIDTTATLACVAALICWTSGPVFIKFLTGHLDSWTQNLLRYSVACLFWLPVLLIGLRRASFDKSIWTKAALPAAANVVMQSLWAASFYYIDPAFMNLLSKSAIIWIAGFSFIFFASERALLKSVRFWSGMGLCVAGVAGVLLYKEDFTAAKTMIGVVIALVSAFTWAIYSICVKIAFKDVDSRDGFSVICIYTVAGLAVLAFLFGEPSECLKMPLWPWACVVISGIVSIALSHVLYYTSIKRIGITIPSLVLLSTPFTVLAISNIVFGETLNLYQWFFGVVLLIGSGLAIWAQEHLG